MIGARYNPCGRGGRSTGISTETAKDPLGIFRLFKTVYELTGSFLGVNREQDIEVFQRLDAILNASRLENLLTYSFFTECLRRDERDLLYKFVDGLQAVENRYLHPVIGLRARQCAWEMAELLHIVSFTFSSDDGEMFRFRLDPADSTAQNREWDRLHDALERSWKAYKGYRQAVKDRLKVKMSCPLQGTLPVN
jgi:hypothetical protein